MDDTTGRREYSGLSEAKARERLEQRGPNRIATSREVTILSIAQEEMTEPPLVSPGTSPHGQGT